MSSRLRKLPLLALVLLAAFALGACGDSHTKVTTGTYAGESGANAPYLDVGPLTYQVQISRELNPYDVEDASYLQGVPPAERQLKPGQEWFGVFIQVYNNSSLAHPAASDLTISRYAGQPLPADRARRRPTSSPIAAASCPPKAGFPMLDSIPSNGPTQGALLLFKIDIASLDNRPAEDHDHRSEGRRRASHGRARRLAARL